MLDPTFQFSGRTVIVTGAVRGIGFAVAERFAQANAVVFLAHRDAAQVEAAATPISGHPAGGRRRRHGRGGAGRGCRRRTHRACRRAGGQRGSAARPGPVEADRRRLGHGAVRVRPYGRLPVYCSAATWTSCLDRLLDITETRWAADDLAVTPATSSLRRGAAGHIVLAWIWLQQPLPTGVGEGPVYDGK